MQTYNKLDKYLWNLAGLFITMPIFVIQIPSKTNFSVIAIGNNLSGLALYNVFILFFIFVKLINRKMIIHLNKKCTVFYLFSVVLLISSCLSFLNVDIDWATYSFKVALKFSVIMLLLSMVIQKKEFKQIRLWFIEGIIWASFAHIVWMILQQLCWIGLHNSIDELLFGMVPSIQNGGIVLTGLSWERANPVFAFAIATIFSQNNKIKIMCLIGTIMTASRTGIFMLAIIYLYWILKYIYNHRMQIKKFEKFFLLIFVVGIFVFGGYIIKPNVFQYFIDNFFYLLKRISWVFIGGNDYSKNEQDAHIMYFMWIPKSLSRMKISEQLFGCGTGISGWIFTTVFGRFKGIGPWSIESDFVSILLGNGIIGTIIYYYMLFKIIIMQKSEQIRILIIVIMVCGFMYGFLMSSLSIILILLSLDFEREKYKMNGFKLITELDE